VFLFQLAVERIPILLLRFVSCMRGILDGHCGWTELPAFTALLVLIALLASITLVAREWMKKPHVLAVCMTEEGRREPELGPTLVAPASVFDATPHEKKAPNGALISVLVAARVGDMYGVKSSSRYYRKRCCQIFVRCGRRTRTFCYTDPSRVLVADLLRSVPGGAGADGYLLFGGKPLSSGMSLLELNIHHGSTVDFCGRIRGGMDGAGGGAEEGAGGGAESAAEKRKKKRARQDEEDEEDLALLQAGVLAISAAASAVALLAADSEVDGRSLPRPGGSNADGRPDYWASPWGRMLTDQATMLNDPTSPQSKVFRRRFRVPFPLFELHVAESKEHLGSKTPIARREGVPMELKILGVFRILGRGACLDDINELSYISPSTMGVFFHAFCKRGRDVLYPKFVSWPTTKEEITKAMGPYMAVGLDGALASTDALHVAWGGCPKDQTVAHTGKEG
jgi:hypothetical protein